VSIVLFATSCIRLTHHVAESDFPPKDDKAKFGVTIAEVMKRRDECQGALFDGHTFIFTPGLGDTSKTLKAVTLANGGKISTQAPTAKMLEDEHKHLVSSEVDAKIWKPLAHNYAVYDKEFVLSSALRQRLEWDDKALRVKGSAK
jgi:hypothetical protein